MPDTKRRLIAACDGTWNSPEQEDNGQPAPTHVHELKHFVAQHDGAGIPQIVEYFYGVGSRGWALRKVLGGAFGYKLEEDIKAAYLFLASNYRRGDEIYLFGFSRGAYTARSVAGMIETVGLLDPEALKPGVDPVRAVDALLKEYQRQKSGEDGLGPFQRRLIGSRRDLPGKDTRRRVDIAFLGVWDTVGAMGIPRDKGLWRWALGDPRNLEFGNAELGASVKCARHALAMDERRLDFTPTYWTKWDGETQDVEQRWFPGVHGDVGGSYAVKELGDLTQAWMLKEAAKCGLGLNGIAMQGLQGNPLGKLHDSRTGIFKRRPTRPRNVPDVTTAPDQVVTINGVASCLDQAVGQRVTGKAQQRDPYWPPIDLTASKAPVTVAVQADQPWSFTGIYLQAGQTYKLTPQGCWWDASIPATAEGARPQTLTSKLAYAACRPNEAIKRRLRRTKKYKDTNVWLTRRHEDRPWFALMACVASGSGAGQQGPQAHEFDHIDQPKTLTPSASGYLYFFANDVWAKYENNSGSLTVEIS